MIQKPKIKAIIFDLGGVVTHSGFKDFVNHYCAVCLTPEGKQKIHDLERDFNIGDLTEDEFYDAMHEVFSIHLSDDEMHDYIVSHMKTDEELVEYIPELKKAKIALLSNTLGAITIEVLKKKDVHVKELFDKVFLSNEMHMVKPDPLTYRHVLETLGVEPGEALMVDDRAEHIEGAKKVGMQGLVYRGAKQFKQDLAKFEIVR